MGIGDALVVGPLYHLWISEKGQLNWSYLIVLFCNITYCTFWVWKCVQNCILQRFVSEFCVLTCSLLIVDFEMACSFIFHLSCKWFWVGSLPRQLLGSSLIIIIMGYAFLPTCLHFARTLKILADILPVI